MRHVLSSKRAGAVATALTLVLNACLSEMPRQLPTEPDPHRNSPYPPSFVPVLATPRLTAQSIAMSNRMRYSDHGVKPATGRSGAAYAEMRALMNKDGRTVLEATTGSFEGAPSENVFEKVQLKVTTAGMGPQNYFPGTPEWTHVIEGLGPTDAIQLQANVRGAGYARTQVVTLGTSVARRPDIAVLALDVPSQGYPATAMTFFATVAELNGDMGARANCLLVVDGAPVDEATGIWVDAGGMVTCQFSYAFAAAGSYSVAVRATGVNPGDWDPDNNSASAAVTIVTAGTPIAFGQVSVADESYVYENRSTRTGAYPIEAVSGGSQQRSQVSFYGTVTEPVPAPLSRVDAQVLTGGVSIYQSSLGQLTSFSYMSGGATVRCSEYSVAGQTAQSCTTQYPNGTGTTWFSYGHSSGKVTYYGNTLYCNTYGCNTYTSNGSTVTGWGARYGLVAGSVVKVRLTFVDAGGDSHVVDRNVTLQDYSGPVNYDRSGCYQYYDGLGEVCYRQTSVGTVWRGQTIW
jgi:hypothetical protein